MVFRPPLPIPSTPHFQDDGKPTIQKQQWLTSIDNMFGSFNGATSGSVLANTGTTTGMPVPTTLTALLDSVFGTGRGSIIVRGASTWASLALGTSTYALTSNGTDLVYSAPPVTGRALISTLTANTSSSLSDTSSLTNAYNTYELVFESIVTSTTTTVGLQIHSGGAFKNTGYLCGGWRVDSGGSTGAVTSTSNLPLTQSTMVGTTTGGLSGFVRISQPSTSGVIHQMWAQLIYAATLSTQHTLTVGGYWNTVGTVDGFQVAPAAGTLTSGKIYIIGLT